MPSKEVDAEAKARAAELQAHGLDERLSTTAGAATKTTTQMLIALKAVRLSPETPSTKKASLVHTAVTKMLTTVGENGRERMFDAIADGRLADVPHVEAAAAWLVRVYKERGGASDDPHTKDGLQISVEEFERAAGVGVFVTQADMKSAVDSALNDVFVELKEKRYRFNSGVLQRRIMEDLRFADGKVVNALIRERIENVLGPKTEADLAKPAKVKKAKAKAKVKPVIKAEEGTEEVTDPFAGIPSRLEARGLKSMENTAELLEKQRKATNGMVITRFPPEPNGHLHIGHAKAMFMDFGYASKMGGECILRFDDTNPTSEKTEYMDCIVEMVHWMGYKPFKITYSSDYFDELFELAVELIRRGKAYVCHQTGDEISRDRKEGVESPYRNRSVEENVKLFHRMRMGTYGEGEATLRMKIDMQHANLVMRDPVAYRVMHSPHPHVGDKWCIYPSYDYTHCLVDSLEWVTHSLCTLEFEIRRDSYYWLLEALDLYRPFVWESARLNLEFTVMSKRKVKQLVEMGIVRGWDDARMPTLSGMRRRGYTPQALRRFCGAIGVSRAANMIGMHVLEHWVRTEHDAHAKRVLAVLRPLKMTIANFRGEEILKIASHPKDEAMGARDVRLAKTVYIERSDFRMQDEKGYYGLAPDKTAMLRYAYPVKVVEVVCGGDGEAEELMVEMDYEKTCKPKGVLHWVAENSVPFEGRLYSNLFSVADPSALKEEWLDFVNKKSEVVVQGGLVEDSVRGSDVGCTFQFERTGYFTVDPDSTKDLLVFNMTVSLRDSR